MNATQKQAIADEYYEQLNLDSAAKTKPQFCLCMIGLPGSGKSTILAELIKRVPMIRQAGDDVKIMLRERNLPDEFAQEIGGIVSEKIKNNGFSVAHDNDFGRADIRAMHASANQQKGIKEIWIRIAPPESYILQILERREAKYFHNKDEQLKTYFMRKKLHEENAAELDKIPYIYVFDPSRSDIAKQIDEAAVRIQAILQVAK